MPYPERSRSRHLDLHLPQFGVILGGMRPCLPHAFIDCGADGRRQVETSSVRMIDHRQGEPMAVSECMVHPSVDLRRNAFGFLAEEQIVARSEAGFPMRPRRLGRVKPERI